MIAIAALLATIASIVLLLFSPFNGVLTTVMLKSFVDASWDKTFLGINSLQTLSVALPVLILPRILFSRTRRFFDMELTGIALAVFFTSMIGVSGLLAAGKFYSSVEYFFRIVSGCMGFVLFQYYFNEREAFRKLILFLLLAGLFPVLVGIYQGLTGTMWRIETTSAGMFRYVGMYHDAFTVRYYGYQTLTAILLYWSYFADRKLIMKAMLALYGCATIFVIFKGYSKTGLLIFVVWAFIWAFVARKIHWLLVIAAAVMVINFTMDNRILNDTERVYMKEIGAYEGTMDEKYILSGRMVVWESAWNKWNEVDTFKKLFGSGANPPVHNEYLRILICNGIVGLLVFIVSLIIISGKVVGRVLARASPLNVTALMVLCMLIIDTIGLHPDLYPAYQWYIYGFITLALSGVTGLDK